MKTSRATLVSVLISILFVACQGDPKSAGGGDGEGGKGSGGKGGSMSGKGGSGTPGEGGSGTPGEGGSGMPGAGGSGTPGAGGTPVAVPQDDLIDDFDDGDDAIPTNGGRVGFWYAFDDASGGTSTPNEKGEFLPEDGGPGGLGKYVHFVGKDFKVWGAGFGVNFNQPAEMASAYDVSMYKGIVFSVKNNVPFRFSIPIQAVLPAADGGTCVGPETGPEQCHDTHGKSIPINAEWKQYMLPFDSLAQANFGKKAPFDGKTVIGIQLVVNKGLTFDLSFDNVGFYK